MKQPPLREHAGILNFTLPLPPSMNVSYRNVVIAGRPRTLLSKQARQYKKDVSIILLGKVGFKDRRLAVVYRFFFKDKRKNDVANREKILTDSLQGILFDDDEQIDEMFLKRGGIDKGNPRVEVRISERK